MADSRGHPRGDVYRTAARHVAHKIRVAPLSENSYGTFNGAENSYGTFNGTFNGSTFNGADSRRYPRDDVYRTVAFHVAQKIRMAPLMARYAR